IVSIDTTKAWAIPGVHLVLTGELMAQRNLAWMPTLSYDTQAVVAMDKVRFQGQEVAAVVADDPYIAKDACEAIEVVYDPLPAIVNPMQATAPDAPLIRDDKDGQTDNVCYTWEVGDRAMTDRVFERADRVVKLDCFYPRSHPSPIECCGCIADYNPATAKLTIYMTTQAPHIIRTAVALVAELPEHMIRIIAPDIGGGFGNKVPVYPGYVIATLASQGHYTNKAPGGVAYRCSFRVTEAMFFQERLIAAAAQDIGMDPAEFRRINFVREFPWRTTYGMLLDSGDYDKCLTLALEKLGYAELRREQA